MLELLQHLLQHLHGYIADPVLLPAPSRGRAVQRGGMRLGGVGRGGHPCARFWVPYDPAGSPQLGVMDLLGDDRAGKSGEQGSTEGGGLQGTPGSGWGCTAPLLVHPSDRTVSGAAHGEEQSWGCEGALAPNIPLK